MEPIKFVVYEKELNDFKRTNWKKVVLVIPEVAEGQLMKRGFRGVREDVFRGRGKSPTNV
jgi:hypothetical protein